MAHDFVRYMALQPEEWLKGTAQLTPMLSLTNSGSGILSVQNVVTLGAGLDATPLPTGVALTVDPAGRTPGIYDDVAVYVSDGLQIVSRKFRIVVQPANATPQLAPRAQAASEHALYRPASA